MIDLLRDLVAHKGYANAALLNAAQRNRAAVSDPELVELLHHILVANRFWLLTILGLPFVHDEEARVSSSFAALIQRYADTQAQETAWLEISTEGDLARRLESPLIPNGTCSIAEALVQVCMHSHGHRAQAAKLLGRHGGVAPPMDFILWLAKRPPAEWT
ncbi:MAG TPA: DinB family protein [Candidatus Eisenbacteria bacterium]|nr:DinB family protein [Candidatus Eisenbacteria bacterium]